MMKILVGLVLLVCSPIAVRSQDVVNSSQSKTFEYFVAPVGPQNPRNSEASIVPLKDGSLLLGWTEFYAGKGADHGPARLSGKISTDRGRSWGKNIPLLKTMAAVT